MEMSVSIPEIFNVENKSIKNDGSKSFDEFLEKHPDYSLEVKNERTNFRDTDGENWSAEKD